MREKEKTAVVITQGPQYFSFDLRFLFELNGPGGLARDRGRIGPQIKGGRGREARAALPPRILALDSLAMRGPLAGVTHHRGPASPFGTRHIGGRERMDEPKVRIVNLALALTALPTCSARVSKRHPGGGPGARGLCPSCRVRKKIAWASGPSQAQGGAVLGFVNPLSWLVHGGHRRGNVSIVADLNKPGGSSVLPNPGGNFAGPTFTKAWQLVLGSGPGGGAC